MENMNESEMKRIARYSSMHRKGIRAFNGAQTKQSYKTAFECFQKAYDLGCEEALVDLGVCYLRGYGVPPDIERGVKILTECYERKLPHAYQAYGRIHELGEGVEQDYEKAMECYLKAIEYGEPRAYSNIANLYLHGNGCEKSVSKAMDAYRNGHKYGDPLSSANLGTIYLEGLFGIDRDYDQAFSFLTKAVQRDNLPSFSRLARCYAGGLGCEKDIQMAEELYSKAYKRGDFNGLNGMAELRKEGAIKASPHKIFNMFRKASENGCLDASFNLGICYLEGFGTKRCFQEACYALSRTFPQSDSQPPIKFTVVQMKPQDQDNKSDFD